MSAERGLVRGASGSGCLSPTRPRACTLFLTSKCHQPLLTCRGDGKRSFGGASVGGIFHLGSFRHVNARFVLTLPRWWPRTAVSSEVRTRGGTRPPPVCSLSAGFTWCCPKPPGLRDREVPPFCPVLFIFLEIFQGPRVRNGDHHLLGVFTKEMAPPHFLFPRKWLCLPGGKGEKNKTTHLVRFHPRLLGGVSWPFLTHLRSLKNASFSFELYC